MFKQQIKDLYSINLNLKDTESLLIFTDTEKEYLSELLEEFVEVGQRMAKSVKHLIYQPTGVHGKEPPEELLAKESFSQEEVVSLLKEKAGETPQVVVAFPYYSTTHTFFRKVLTDEFGARYASMPLFDPSMFHTSMNVDWEFVRRLSSDVAEMLTEAEWVHVISDYGTDMEFSIAGRKGFADTGLFHNPGDYGNLPAGEAFVAPVENEAYGKLVVLYAPDRRLERPITFRFIDGGVESIEGFENYRYFVEDLFKSMPSARFIAEFGVGTNPRASRPDNVLEAEKILGTVHIAIGDNHTFGGANKVGFHTDYVVFEPTVRLGGRGWEKELLQRGKLQKI